MILVSFKMPTLLAFPSIGFICCLFFIAYLSVADVLGLLGILSNWNPVGPTVSVVDPSGKVIGWNGDVHDSVSLFIYLPRIWMRMHDLLRIFCHCNKLILYFMTCARSVWKFLILHLCFRYDLDLLQIRFLLFCWSFPCVSFCRSTCFLWVCESKAFCCSGGFGFECSFILRYHVR